MTRKRNTTNTIKRKRTFEQKRTGKIMPKLSQMTEDLTHDLFDALRTIKVRDFESVADYVKARKEIFSQFAATRREMLHAVEDLNKLHKHKF